jgi:hypothetical protein
MIARLAVTAAAFAAAAVLAGPAAALPAAEAASGERCGSLGSKAKPLIDRIRASGLSCHDAVTTAAKWVEAEAQPGTQTVHGFSCRRTRAARGVYKVRCRQTGGPALVTFRYLKRNR